ncbi:hypothetical protein D3C86_1739210 [compost metagenome]
MGNGERRPGTFTAVGQHVWRSFQQGDQQQDDHPQHCAQRRQSQAKQATDPRRADDPAEAEQTVKPRHHVLAAGAFDDHGLQVDR